MRCSDKLINHDLLIAHISQFKCLCIVLNSSLDLEVIIVDDNSPDKTQDVIAHCMHWISITILILRLQKNFKKYMDINWYFFTSNSNTSTLWIFLDSSCETRKARIRICLYGWAQIHNR